MLTKVFPTGEGKGYGPVEYLCAVNPFGRGEREKAPQVISGNPAFIKSQIDAVPFKHKYTSGVHSFAPEDKPTDEQIMEVIEATEELAFAGLPLSSRSILWVKHEHAGRTELHFLIPRQEVNSGKAFNAFPPGWQHKYDPLCDKFNYKYGWARPDDPARARHWQPGINAKIMQDAKRREKQNPRSEVFSLTDDLANMAIQGKLANRSDIVSELRRRGYGINRQGKDYLTIIDQNGKKTRLKGTLFGENFNGPDWIKAQLVKIDKPDSEKVLIDLKLAEEADAKLQEEIRKSAQYNINRYSLREEENEQSAGKQHITKSEIDQGNLGSSHEGYSGESAPFQESLNNERDESHALYTESGLGENASDRAASGSIRGNAGYPLQTSSLSDPSFVALGGAMGTGSEMAESNRGAATPIYEWGYKDSQHSFGTGAGDYRGQPGKPRRNDEADHGQPERVARQSFQFGELVQNFRSLKKGTKKLEDRLARLNQAEENLPEFDLGLRPAIEEMDKFAGNAISALRRANETRSLRNLLNQDIVIAPIETGNLLIAGDEVLKWLRVVYESKLLQKLAKSGTHSVTPYLEELSLQTSVAAQNLACAHETRILASPAHEPPILQIPDMWLFENEADNAIHVLHQANELRILQKLGKSPDALKFTPLNLLADTCTRTGALLKEVNDVGLVQKLSHHGIPFCLPELSIFEGQTRILNRLLHIAQEAKILAAVCKRERKREKFIQQCFLHAEWAGSDLQRWDRVFAEYRKYSKRLKVLNGLIHEAHSRFLGILAKTRKMREVQKCCRNDPFLLHEYGILKDKMNQYDVRQTELKKNQDFGRSDDDNQKQTSSDQDSTKSNPSLKM